MGDSQSARSEHSRSSDKAFNIQESSTRSLSHEGESLEQGLNINSEASKISEVDFQSVVTDEGPRPPLPPRPKNLEFLQPGGSLQRPKTSSRPTLQSSATTALSLADIHTQSYQDGSRDTLTTSAESTPSEKTLRGYGSIRKLKEWNRSEGDDSASIKSYAPTLETGGDAESLLGEVLGGNQESPAWKLLSSHLERLDPFESINYEDDTVNADFDREFDELDQLDKEGNNEGSDNLLSPVTFVEQSRRTPFVDMEIQT